MINVQKYLRSKESKEERKNRKLETTLHSKRGTGKDRLTEQLVCVRSVTPVANASLAEGFFSIDV